MRETHARCVRLGRSGPSKRQTKEKRRDNITKATKLGEDLNGWSFLEEYCPETGMPARGGLVFVVKALSQVKMTEIT